MPWLVREALEEGAWFDRARFRRFYPDITWVRVRVGHHRLGYWRYSGRNWQQSVAVFALFPGLIFAEPKPDVPPASLPWLALGGSWH